MATRERSVGSNTTYTPIYPIDDTIPATYERILNEFPSEYKELFMKFYNTTDKLRDFSRYVFGTEPVGEYGTGNYQVFYENGEFVVPTTGTYRIKVVGGGGGGRISRYKDSVSSDWNCSGGRGGGFAMKEVSLNAGESYPITVAAKANFDTNGNSSSFGTLLSASGGSSGNSSTSDSHAGVGVGGDVNYRGGYPRSTIAARRHIGGFAPACELGDAVASNISSEGKGAAGGDGLRSYIDNTYKDAQTNGGGGLFTPAYANASGGIFIDPTRTSDCRCILGLVAFTNRNFNTTGYIDRKRPFIAARLSVSETIANDVFFYKDGKFKSHIYIRGDDGSLWEADVGVNYPYNNDVGETYGMMFGCGGFPIDANYNSANYQSTLAEITERDQVPKPFISIGSNTNNYYGSELTTESLQYTYLHPMAPFTAHGDTTAGWGGGGGGWIPYHSGSVYYTNAVNSINLNGNYGGGGGGICADNNIKSSSGLQNDGSTDCHGGHGGVGGGGGGISVANSNGAAQWGKFPGNGGIGAGGGCSGKTPDDVSKWGCGGAGIVIVEW